MTDRIESAEEGGASLPPVGGDEPRRPRRDFFGAVAFLAIALVFVVQALRMPFKDPSFEWYTAPNAFPLAMALCLGAASLYVALRGLVGWHASRQTIGPIRWIESARAWALPRFVGGAAMVALLIALLGKVNFYVLAPASIVTFALLFRNDPLRKALKSSLIAAAFIVVFLYAIAEVFGIVFP